MPKAACARGPVMPPARNDVALHVSLPALNGAVMSHSVAVCGGMALPRDGSTVYTVTSSTSRRTRLRVGSDHCRVAVDCGADDTDEQYIDARRGLCLSNNDRPTSARGPSRITGKLNN